MHRTSLPQSQSSARPIKATPDWVNNVTATSRRELQFHNIWRDATAGNRFSFLGPERRVRDCMAPETRRTATVYRIQVTTTGLAYPFTFLFSSYSLGSASYYSRLQHLLVDIHLLFYFEAPDEIPERDRSL